MPMVYATLLLAYPKQPCVCLKVNIYYDIVTNFIQLVSPQPVDQFSQTKLCWKAPNESYSHICGMYKMTEISGHQ